MASLARHRWPETCSAAAAADSASPTEKARKTSSTPLGLVVNAIALWNTRYMAAALEHSKPLMDRFGSKTSNGYHLCATTTPTCMGGTTSSPQTSSPEVNSATSGTFPTLGLRLDSPALLRPAFCSNTPRSPSYFHFVGVRLTPAHRSC